MGGVEMEIGVLFADVRGFTSLSETLPPAEVAELLNRFYACASRILGRAAVIDKLVGDEVMALYIPQLIGERWEDDLLRDARELLEAVGFGPRSQPWLRLGIGLDVGRAFVGNVGSGEVKDFTALGDVVNTASRLQSSAGAGQIVLSERLFGRLSAPPAGGTPDDRAEGQAASRARASPRSGLIGVRRANTTRQPRAGAAVMLRGRGRSGAASWPNPRALRRGRPRRPARAACTRPRSRLRSAPRPSLGPAARCPTRGPAPGRGPRALAATVDRAADVRVVHRRRQRRAVSARTLTSRCGSFASRRARSGPPAERLEHEQRARDAVARGPEPELDDVAGLLSPQRPAAARSSSIT